MWNKEELRTDHARLVSYIGDMGAGSALVALIVLVFVGYEAIRFRELHQTCIRTQEENERLLHNVLCADAWQRALHGPKQEELCRRAREENDRTPMECAWRALWTEGEFHQLWVRVSTSYWLLFGLGAPALCTMVYMWFSNRNQAAARRDQRELFQEMAKALRPPPPTEGLESEPSSIALEYQREVVAPVPRRRLMARPSWHHNQEYSGAAPASSYYYGPAAPAAVRVVDDPDYVDLVRV